MIWLPGFARVDLDGQPHGATYDDTSTPKLGWHTWEGFSWSSAEAAFRKYPPHCAVFPPWPGKEKSVGRRQYVSLDRHAYAFAGSENDDEYVIQVEVAGRAIEMRHAPDVVLRWLATEVVAPIEAAVGVPRTVVRFGFRDTGFLASPKSPIRLNATELRQFSGHLGHQHMPAPDQHWDPGALPIDRILNYLDDHHQEDDDMAVLIYVKPTQEWWVTDFVQKRGVAADGEVDRLKMAGLRVVEFDRKSDADHIPLAR